MKSKKTTHDTTRMKRICLNALLTATVTSITIFLSIPSSDISHSFVIAAVLSGILAAARELQEKVKGESELAFAMVL